MATGAAGNGCTVNILVVEKVQLLSVKVYVMVAVPSAFAKAAPVFVSTEIIVALDVAHVPPVKVCVKFTVSFKQIPGEFIIAGPTCKILLVVPFIVIEFGVK